MKKVNSFEESGKVKLKEFFLRLAYAPDEELDELVSLFTPVVIPKKTIIIDEGENSEDVYFIVDGLMRIYYHNDSKEVTNWFIPENGFFAATYSLLTKEKNMSIYETIEDSKMLTVKYSTLEAMYRKYHSLEHIGRRLIEYYYSLYLRKSYDLLYFSAEEQYNTFLKNKSDLINRVPLRMVASYLGISQETLSRIRGRH